MLRCELSLSISIILYKKEICVNIYIPEVVIFKTNI